jgi:hypothetical protein
VGANPAALQFLRVRVSSYTWCAGDEFWKQDHEDAMACSSLEAVLQNGLGLYRSIRKRTEGVKVDSEVLDLIGRWLRPGANAEKRIRRFEGRNSTVDGAREFREAWQDAIQLSRLVPTPWRGQTISTEAEPKEVEFPNPPEPE